MFIALMIASLILAFLIGGKALLIGMASLPIIGGFAGWYAGLVEPYLLNGPVANLIYGAMALQTFILPLGVVFYGPRLTKQLVAKLRHQQQAANREKNIWKM